MKCLVLGGAGFIGSHVVDALVEGGHEVRVFDRPNISTENLTSHLQDIQIVHGDFFNASDIASALDGMEIVIHLISTTLPGPSNENPIYDVESNVLSTLQLLDASVKGEVKKIIFASSGGTVYGMPERVPIPETHSTNPICSYGITKLMIEKYIQLYHHLYGLNYTILRLANPYGERQRLDNVQGLIAVLLGRLAKKRPVTIWGDGTVSRDYFYISDLVESFMMAIENISMKGIFNIASGKAISITEIIHTIERITGERFLVEQAPPRKLDVPINCLDISLSKKVLNWTPKVGLEDGIDRTWRWLKALENNKKSKID